MKKICLLLLVQMSFCAISLLAQTNGKISNLDAKNGVKIFKLNSDFSLYKNSIEELPKKPEDSKNLKRYRYTAECCPDYSGVPIMQIILVYYKNKLASIIIDLNESAGQIT